MRAAAGIKANGATPYGALEDADHLDNASWPSSDDLSIAGHIPDARYIPDARLPDNDHSPGAPHASKFHAVAFELDSGGGMHGGMHDGLSAEGDLARLFRVISWHLLPIFFVLNCLNFLDRSNLAFASIQMSRDLDFSPLTYGIGSGLFFVGYSICQIPSQIILKRVGAPTWLTIIVTSWGIVATCMAGIQGPWSFFFVRLALGVTESGSFPGYWYYLTKFYPDKHITLPYSITDSAIMVAQVIGAPLAAGLLHLNGLFGLLGWQWLFIAEGIPTALLGVSLWWLLPECPASARFLDAEEGVRVQREVDACRGGENTDPQASTWTLLKRSLSTGPMWHIAVVKFMKDLTAYGCMFWTPLLIQSLLHHREVGEGGSACDAWKGDGDEDDEAENETGYLAVLLTGIPYIAAVLLNIVLAYNSQRTKERVKHVGIPYIIGGVSFMLLPIANGVHIVLSFVLLTLTISMALAANGVLLALASALAQGPSMAINLAMYNSVANTSGIVANVTMGAVLHYTCSYNAVFLLFGSLLIVGGSLALLIKDPNDERSATAAAALNVHEDKLPAYAPADPTANALPEC